MNNTNKINKILKYKNQFIGIAQGIQIMEKFSEMVKQYRDPNGAVSYYDITSNSDISLNLTTELLNSIFRDCYSDYVYTYKLKTNKFYNSMFEVLKLELESWYEKKYLDIEIGRILKVILECFFFIGEKNILDCCDEVPFIENLKDCFRILYNLDEKDSYVMALKTRDILTKNQFLLKNKSLFRDTILSFKEPLFVLDFRITSIKVPLLLNLDNKFSSEYLISNLNQIIFNYFLTLDLIKKELMLLWFTSKKHKKIFNDYYNDYNDMDIITYYNKLEFVEHPKTVYKDFFDCVNYIHVKKNSLNTWLSHCVIIGCFQSYNNLNLEFESWKIPINNIELDYK